jgi:hypothetical protein
VERIDEMGQSPGQDRSTAELVNAISGVVAWLSALIGKARLQRATPPVPGQAVDSVKTDVEEIKERVRR